MPSRKGLKEALFDDACLSALLKELVGSFSAYSIVPKGESDQVMENAAKIPRVQAALRTRMRPFGTTSYYEVFRAVQEYRLAETAGQITCPMLLTDPEGEQFFPGQSQKLYDALRNPGKKLIHFTRDQGAVQHCEINAPGYRDYCIYNWLAETLG